MNAEGQVDARLRERYGGGPRGQKQGTVLAREACGAAASGLEEGERGIDPDDDVLPG